MITQTSLRAFVAVAEAGNISAAARRLGRVPSAVSMALKQLEEALGGKLFERDRKSDLTALGRHTFERAEAGLRRYDAAVDDIRAYAEGEIGRLDIACVPSVAAYLLPGMVDAFTDTHPQIHLDIRDIDTTSIEGALLAGEVDVAIAGTPQAREAITFEPLFEDRFVLVCGRTSPLAARECVEWDEIAGQTLIANGASVRMEDPRFQALAARSRLMVHNMASLLALVRRNVGVTLLPQLSLPREEWDLVWVQISGEALLRPVGVHGRRGESRSPVAKDFVDRLRAHVATRIEEEAYMRPPGG